MQKYHKGDRVKVKYGHLLLSKKEINENGVVPLGISELGYAYDISPSLTEDIATVQYSYNERYGGGSSGDNQYNLKFDKYGSISWFNDSQLIKV